MQFDKYKILARISDSVVRFTGKPETLLGVCATIVIWLLAGPLFRFDAFWYAAIQTTSAVVTLLMVFIIQDSQNRDTATLHLKLDELIRSHGPAKNELLDLEKLTSEQLNDILALYKQLAATPHDTYVADREIDIALANAKRPHA